MLYFVLFLVDDFQRRKKNVKKE